MNERLAHIDVEAQFNALTAQLGDLAVMDQIQRPMPDLPPVSQQEVNGFINQLEQRPTGLTPLTEEEINKFTAQLENDQLEGEDEAFFEKYHLTAA